jgi:adenylate kinase family enzyme
MEPIRFVGLAEAAELARQTDRMIVIGCSGSGKSTLAQKAAALLDLPYISIDRDVLWLPGWILRERAEQRRLTEELIARDRWIMDGTGSSTLSLRLPRTELIIWPDLPRFACVAGILRRWVTNLGRTRPEMTPGCPEKIDLEFLRYVWTWNREVRPRVMAGIQNHASGKPVVMLKSHREMDEFLRLVNKSPTRFSPPHGEPVEPRG